jgi:opacity protein-like surface antigen
MIRTRKLVRTSLILLLPALAPCAAMAGDLPHQYVAARVVSARLHADGMDLSARPGIGAFVPGKESASDVSGSLAYGQRIGDHWRVEGEVALPQSAEFTSGSTRFPSSYNHHRLQVSRLMGNLLREFPLGQNAYAYAAAGLGVSRVESSGWQGTVARQYGRHTQQNLSWSLGAGAGYRFSPRVDLEAGYRWLDAGQVESGYNRFSNARGLVDEQMRLDLASGEAYLGVNVHF